MAIPPVNDDDARNRRYLAEVYKLFVQAGERGYSNVSMETLSMGMSGDFENAIREGATLVRIGTAIYGERIIVKSKRTNPLRHCCAMPPPLKGGGFVQLPERCKGSPSRGSWRTK